MAEAKAKTDANKSAEDNMLIALQKLVLNLQEQQEREKEAEQQAIERAVAERAEADAKRAAREREKELREVARRAKEDSERQAQKRVDKERAKLSKQIDSLKTALAKEKDKRESLLLSMSNPNAESENAQPLQAQPYRLSKSSNYHANAVQAPREPSATTRHLRRDGISNSITGSENAQPLQAQPYQLSKSSNHRASAVQTPREPSATTKHLSKENPQINEETRPESANSDIRLHEMDSRSSSNLTIELIEPPAKGTGRDATAVLVSYPVQDTISRESSMGNRDGKAHKHQSALEFSKDSVLLTSIHELDRRCEDQNNETIGSEDASGEFQCHSETYSTSESANDEHDSDISPWQSDPNSSPDRSVNSPSASESLARLAANEVFSILQGQSGWLRSHGADGNATFRQHSISRTGEATSSSTGGAAKRIVSSHKRDNDEDFPDDNRPRKFSKQRAFTDPDAGRLLACPFYKRDPLRHRRCNKYMLREISRLK